ncbi:MAG TPA: thiamine phosphate synthase [Methanothrix sp.]|nr:thiamine phosphate synthase [Methanothrix sp.]HPC89519.1 thiamine phosphate synthase [Methanothrix sp.]HQE87385.1 thiamine phosphate synthase [Methanothrix sp.]HRS84840.1 thiamine phosphate synthase [Methanothrix sp.]HRT16983.1 thiamine phosphate synthase [Methanothrix sp.]
MSETFKGYYFITDARLSRAGNTSDVISAISCKVSVVQYRNKDAETREMYYEARRLGQLCREAGAAYLINDRVDIALSVDADGVHLGQSDMPFAAARRLLGPDKIIGLTVHNLAEALEGERLGADYLGVSPIFSTATKPDAGKPAGISLIEQIRRKVSLPLIAIGGINHSNARQVVAAGADGLCAISCVVASESARDEMRRFQDLFRI